MNESGRLVASAVEGELMARRDVGQALELMRFFRTGPGEYGEGDAFLGIKVPVTRSVVRRYASAVALDDVSHLLESPWHELRLAGFLLLIEIYRRRLRTGDYPSQREVVDFYLSKLHRANNWDLVDVVAPKILGDWLCRHPRERGVLYELAAMDASLWHQRVAMVCCWALIRAGEYADTLRLSAIYLTHPHDLMHKATGWMLREVGKRGGVMELLGFLDRHAPAMPRTMLRYAMERLPQDVRSHYMALPRIKKSGRT